MLIQTLETAPERELTSRRRKDLRMNWGTHSPRIERLKIKPPVQPTFSAEYLRNDATIIDMTGDEPVVYQRPERRRLRDRVKNIAHKAGDVALKASVHLRSNFERVVESPKTKVALGLGVFAVGTYAAIKFGSSLGEHSDTVTVIPVAPKTPSVFESSEFKAIVERPQDFHTMVEWGIQNPGQDGGQALETLSKAIG